MFLLLYKLSAFMHRRRVKKFLKVYLISNWENINETIHDRKGIRDGDIYKIHINY